ncbi:DEAD/DEAH box helicase [Amycolatopsis anabasis]|uniref:DEAD/DEAH box helicase n=1 Tax=Amycolatopsis anabasis TaxID=1840409 RepID=UPI00131C261D|nr:DEAD/DEAH box helicase [Amycolatopsis anabasis]
MSSAADRLLPALVHHIVNTLGWPELRPLQAEAIDPLLRGSDAILLAPTAGGKTEAAVFPLLSAMEEQSWLGISVLYVCPLRALLNNLQPRLASYAGWLGRSAEVWHGDVGPGARERMRREPPDILLTTPESLEAMLVSSKVDSRRMFSGLRAVVVDEVHAFAGDDRGWHLLAVLERLSRIAGRPLQRVGLSATVGNPAELLEWLQGSQRSRPRSVVAPVVGATTIPDLTVDHVGSIENAATVIASLHRGEKRLVFVDSRRRAEELGAALRAREVTTFLSHSSLSADERHRSEQAFAEARDCVIVATSTLELGIDVGDLDRVIQINTPRTVASFLQRLGRTGRRPESTRNCLFLCLEDAAVLSTAGLLERWAAGWVEPIVAPVRPRHIAAQQILALALQENKIGMHTWPEWWGDLPLFDEHLAEIFDHLLAKGYLERDGAMAFIGPEAEKKFGRRYFSDLLAVFTAPPEFTVLAGREEIGRVGDDVLLADDYDGPSVLLLAGRAWKVGHVDWKRRRCFVEPSDLPGRAKWGSVESGMSFALTRGQRSVLLGAEPAGVRFTRRAASVLADLREKHAEDVSEDATVFRRSAGEFRWWTWAGAAANRTLQANFPRFVDPRQRITDHSLRLLPNISNIEFLSELSGSAPLSCPNVSKSAVNGLKFSTALPEVLAIETVAERLSDRKNAAIVLSERRVFVHAVR